MSLGLQPSGERLTMSPPYDDRISHYRVQRVITLPPSRCDRTDGVRPTCGPEAVNIGYVRTGDDSGVQCPCRTDRVPRCVGVSHQLTNPRSIRVLPSDSTFPLCGRNGTLDDLCHRWNCHYLFALIKVRFVVGVSNH